MKFNTKLGLFLMLLAIFLNISTTSPGIESLIVRCSTILVFSAGGVILLFCGDSDEH